MAKIHVFGGGTFSHVRNHLAIAAPAFGETANEIFKGLRYSTYRDFGQELHLTKMAGGDMVTNEDVERKLDEVIADPETRVIIFNVALCDFNGQIGEVESGKYAERLKSREGPFEMKLTVADKLIGKIRKERKDIFVVGFKTTAGATSDEQYVTALNMLKANSINLVLANDTVTRNNMIVAPEETRYSETKDRTQVIRQLIQMVGSRATNTFTRSTVVPGDYVSWASPEVPENLRKVVDHCIARGAYKPFRGVTAGHFAVKLSPTSILTTRRKHNFNRVERDLLVRVDYEGLDRVVAHGFKPSVGGQSQRIIFDQHPDAECIVHFHSPFRGADKGGFPDLIPTALQWPYECGSHQCGENTSTNLKDFDGIKAVMLHEHGPNIVFNRNTDADKIIKFIEANFDLDHKTGGMVNG